MEWGLFQKIMNKMVTKVENDIHPQTAKLIQLVHCKGVFWDEFCSSIKICGSPAPVPHNWTLFERKVFADTIKMRLLLWALIKCDWYSCKKGEIGQREDPLDEDYERLRVETKRCRKNIIWMWETGLMHPQVKENQSWPANQEKQETDSPS